MKKTENRKRRTVKLPSGSLIIKKDNQRSKILPEKKKIKKGAEEKPETEAVKIAIDHILLPMHEILSADEAKALVENLKVKMEQLPKIFNTDPALQHLNPKIGDIVKISRNSQTAGTTTYYRIVIENEDFVPGEE